MRGVMIAALLGTVICLAASAKGKDAKASGEEPRTVGIQISSVEKGRHGISRWKALSGIQSELGRFTRLPGGKKVKATKEELDAFHALHDSIVLSVLNGKLKPVPIDRARYRIAAGWVQGEASLELNFYLEDLSVLPPKLLKDFGVEKLEKGERYSLPPGVKSRALVGKMHTMQRGKNGVLESHGGANYYYRPEGDPEENKKNKKNKKNIERCSTFTKEIALKYLNGQLKGVPRKDAGFSFYIGVIQAAWELRVKLNLMNTGGLPAGLLEFAKSGARDSRRSPRRR